VVVRVAIMRYRSSSIYEVPRSSARPPWNLSPPSLTFAPLTPPSISFPYRAASPSTARTLVLRCLRRSAKELNSSLTPSTACSFPISVCRNHSDCGSHDFPGPLNPGSGSLQTSRELLSCISQKETTSLRAGSSRYRFAYCCTCSFAPVSTT
jgi:hypothetical protein